MPRGSLYLGIHLGPRESVAAYVSPRGDVRPLRPPPRNAIASALFVPDPNSGSLLGPAAGDPAAQAGLTHPDRLVWFERGSIDEYLARSGDRRDRIEWMVPTLLIADLCREMEGRNGPPAKVVVSCGARWLPMLQGDLAGVANEARVPIVEVVDELLALAVGLAHDDPSIDPASPQLVIDLGDESVGKSSRAIFVRRADDRWRLVYRPIIITELAVLELATPELFERLLQLFSLAGVALNELSRIVVTGERVISTPLRSALDLLQAPIVDVDDLQQLAARGAALLAVLPEEANDSIPMPRAAPMPTGVSAPTTAAQSPPTVIDENVQFTVYRPKTIAPQKWVTLLAFAHLEELPDDAPPDEPQPAEVVQLQAAMLLGPQLGQYKPTTPDEVHAIPKAGEITFVPEMAGIEFNPPRHTFRWEESVHRAEFRLRAGAELDGQTAAGRFDVFLGAILITSVPLRIRVESTLQSLPVATLTGMEPALEPATARPYRKIFASYSHRDLPIVEQFERYIESLGDRYLRDWRELRAGEQWNARLMAMIEEADVFQLFWSQHSMSSPFVRQEWEHALSLTHKGPGFVRPMYWEDPFPEDAAAELPPPVLRDRHFSKLGGSTGSPGAAPHASAEASEPRPSEPSSPRRSGDLAMRGGDDEDFLYRETYPRLTRGTPPDMRPRGAPLERPLPRIEGVGAAPDPPIGMTLPPRSPTVSFPRPGSPPPTTPQRAPDMDGDLCKAEFPAKRGSSWTLWIIVIVVLALLAWWLLF